MARVRFAARACALAAVLGLLPTVAFAAAPEVQATEAGKSEEAKPKPAEPKPKPADAKPKPPEAKPVASDGKAKSPEATAADGKARAPEAKPRSAEAKPKTEEAKPKPPESKARTSTPGSEPALATEEPSPGGPGSKAGSAPDPQRGLGTRSVAGLPSASKATGSAPPSEPVKFLKPEKSGKSEAASAHAAHQKGKPPRKASATLPLGAVHPLPDPRARQKIADGFTDEDLRAGKDDPELRSLKAAERVLFPRPLSGVEPGWSWDLPEATQKSGPEVSTEGAPTLRASGAYREAASGAPDAAWLKGLTLPNLPVVLDEFVIKYLRFYRDSPSGKAILRVWTKKSGRFTAAMKGELGRAGVPTDLVWLSMIESGHNPTISSPAGAAGLWQFMPDAGRSYGLIVDRWVDERLDPERSTQAASRYLSDLYRRFGSWDLALASYNMGYGGLARSIRKFNSNDFWELVRYEAGIPWETTLYVPKIFALAIVMNNQATFGLDALETEPPEAFDVVQVGPSVPLSEVARAAGVAENALFALNPALLAGRTPPWLPGSPKPSWRVRVPPGRGAACTAGLARMASDDEALEAYVTKLGETVESVANAHGVSEARLRAINHVEPKEVLAGGTVLLVPRSARAGAAAPSDDVVVVPPREFAYAERSRLFYRVVSGDTLSRVAQVFAVSVADLGSWNALDVTRACNRGWRCSSSSTSTRAFRRARWRPPKPRCWWRVALNFTTISKLRTGANASSSARVRTTPWRRWASATG